MIDIKDLRVGNIFKYVDNTPCYFAGAWQRQDGWIVRDSAGNTYKENDLYAIELTPEILEKCEFYNSKDGKYSMFWIKSGLQFRWRNEDNLRIKIQASYVEIKHLHQLQNLYFALTGEELKVKL